VALNDLAGVIENGHVQPWILAVVPGRPDDRRDPGLAEIE